MIGTDIIHLGDDMPRGAYLLYIQVKQNIHICPGKLTGGSAVPLASGAYIYIGSAQGRLGTPLAARLLRHTRRVNGQKHQIAGALKEFLAERGWLSGYSSSRTKKFHWHIDYLLEEEAVELAGIIIVSGEAQLEGSIARSILNDSVFSFPIHGFGSSDDAVDSHLFEYNGEIEPKELLYRLRELTKSLLTK